MLRPRLVGSENNAKICIKMDAAGIRPMANAKRLLREAYRMWFAGLTFNVIAGMYSLWQIRQKEQKIDKNEGEGVVESKKLAKYYSHEVDSLGHTLINFLGSAPMPISSSYLIFAI